MTLRPRTHGRAFNILCRIHTYILRYATISISNYRRIVYYSVYNARRLNDTINIKGCRSRARASSKDRHNVIIIILIYGDEYAHIILYIIINAFARQTQGVVRFEVISFHGSETVPVRGWTRTPFDVKQYTYIILNTSDIFRSARVMYTLCVTRFYLNEISRNSNQWRDDVCWCTYVYAFLAARTWYIFIVETATALAGPPMIVIFLRRCKCWCFGFKNCVLFIQR